MIPTANHITKKNARLCIILLGVVSLLLFGSTRNQASVSVDASDESEARSVQQLPPEVTRQIMGQTSADFAVSQEMKENADFLLTPAILLQDAMSEGIVITYPSE